MVSLVSSSSMAQRFDAVFAEASRATGAKFDFLLATAKRESGLRVDAKAPTSSATGLFQFIESTWLETMKEAGPALGYGSVADKIRKVGNDYIVPDRSERQEILAMRKDAKISALMAGAYARKNEAQLSQALGRTPKSGELYAAHFLGAQGSARLIGMSERQPDLAADRLFPDQAKANRNVFYHRNGQAKSVREVYDNLVATVPNETGLATEAGQSGQSSSAPLAYVDHLGDRFRKKTSELVSFMAQMENAPVRRSRYGGEMDVTQSANHGGRPSRYAQSASLSPSTEPARSVASSNGGETKAAPVNLLPDQAVPADAETMAVLPKSKPAGLAHAGQRFVELLGASGQQSALPESRSKPSFVSSGALDLSDYLSGARKTDPEG
ncbi:MAG: lytic transglycosylase domain-containing protein [Cohaesibacter sp.]|nr:lytic transglycosylase domain-containing protein [Cohaesibacter sp.]